MVTMLIMVTVVTVVIMAVTKTTAVTKEMAVTKATAAIPVANVSQALICRLDYLAKKLHVHSTISEFRIIGIVAQTALIVSME